MPAIKGKILPLGSKVMVSNMNFDSEVTESGIVVLSDDGKSSGIHPRWAQVWAVGPKQLDVKPGDWVLLEHGRWSRGHKYETENGDIIEIRLADEQAILMVSDEKPKDVVRSVIGHFNLNLPT
jgi:hypothetical protein